MAERHERPGAGGVADPPIEPRPADPPAPEPAPPGAEAPPPAEPVVVPRWIQLVVLPLAILGAWALVRSAGPITLLFVVAALIALLLNPFVALLQRRRVPRGLAVLLVYLVLIVGLVGLGIVLAGPIGDQASSFGRSVPGIVDDANAELASLQRWLDERGVDVEVQAQGRTALATLGERVSAGSGELVTFTREALTLLIEGSIALILIVVLSVYMLLYGQRIGAAVRRVVPRGDGTPGDDYPTRVQRAVFGYVRGQLLFSTIMGTSAGVALWIMGSLGVFPDGKTYALVFGAWYGFAELIPYVGPAIGAAPPVLLALVGGDPLDALWLTIMFIALQQIEGHIVAPTVFAQALRINPIFVIAALLIGGRLYGFAGAFIALPIAAVLRETVVYFRRHLVLEPWGTPPAAALAGAGSGVSGASPPAAHPCGECGA
ncbi:MAG TPA: AI-2E family transporter, partial [Solirubrobacteraceae bacterium]|nr:AI-2E family transporter [Solirubrobacteraceae bacterium]